MWLKAFQSDDKLLSESEFWILTVVPDSYVSPSEIMDRLYRQTRDWTPKPGTIYPILHRLSDVELLDKSEDDGLSFRRSGKARIFLSSIAKPLRVQVLETCNYYTQILHNLAELDQPPVRYYEILAALSKAAIGFGKESKALSLEVQEKMDQPYDVPISFED